MIQFNMSLFWTIPKQRTPKCPSLFDHLQMSICKLMSLCYLLFRWGYRNIAQVNCVTLLAKGNKSHKILDSPSHLHALIYITDSSQIVSICLSTPHAPYGALMNKLTELVVNPFVKNKLVAN